MILLNFTRKFEYDFHEPTGLIATRTIPAGLAVEVDDDVAAAALAEDAAKAPRPLTPELAARVERYKTMISLAAQGLSPEQIATELEARAAAAAATTAAAEAEPQTGVKPRKIGKLKSVAT